VCAPGDPWSPDKGDYVVHPGAVEVYQEDGWPGGDIVGYECPYCHHRFKVELPQ
jgi:hypothetical protein